MNIKYSDLVTNSGKSKLDKCAADLRLRSSIELYDQEVDLSTSCLTPTHFEDFWEALPLEDAERDIRFNSLVTKTALERFILPMADPYSVLYLGSKVVEQSFYNVFRLDTPTKPLRNLSVAKRNGVFFTPREIASKMVSLLEAHREPSSLLDPCLGAGALLGEGIIRWRSLPYESFHGIEVDQFIASCAQLILERVGVLSGFTGEISIETGDGLETLMNQSQSSGTRKVDVIINPPYGRMRFTKDIITNKETSLNQERMSGTLSATRLANSSKDASQRIFQRFPELKVDSGIPELSKLFLHACVLNAQNGSNVSFIGPDTWMSGRQTAALRKKVLETRTVSEVFHVKEGDRAFSTVNQHTSVIFMQAGRHEFLSVSDFGEKEYTHIRYEEIEKKVVDFVGIPRLPDGALKVYQKLDGLSKFGQLSWLKNARGEVDQTLQKSLFREKETNIPLVRGVHVERLRYDHTSSEEKPSFVDEEQFRQFIGGKPKENDVYRERIVGRQCSYSQQVNRLVFCRIPAGCAVGNSCNYITVDEVNDAGPRRSSVVLGLLHSSLMDWFFRASNCNNHVANYEIDNFPFPQSEELFPGIAAVTEKLETVDHAQNPKLYNKLCQLLDAHCCLTYGIDIETELESILEAHGKAYTLEVSNLARNIRRGVKIDYGKAGKGHFNHDFPKLSDLDMLVIESVPEGGNWQDIPLSVPGERLAQIRKMTEERGVVRTTYYGRLRRDHPSYTINTYFNRPGNGTHIHPVENRTLTSREAARLQSFPDSYIFTGSQAAVRNQIGNAVPPLLARAVGEKLYGLAPGNICVDMFCGAGGLSLGLEAAGWHTLCGVDNDQHALNTFSVNRPCFYEPRKLSIDSTAALRRDLLDDQQRAELLRTISAALGERTLDLLIGGPPCQGFSHAGYRNPADRRNDLASIFIEFAECLRPNLFVLENVEGLATMKKGQVLADITRTLEEFGYTVSNPIWKLFSEEFGVPQMRRRLFVVASLNPDVSLAPPQPTHIRCRGRREVRNEVASWLDENLMPYNTVQSAFQGLSLKSDDTQSTHLREWLN